MDKHYGETLELTIRKKGVSITFLANELNVNRGIIYSYFKTRNLQPTVIHRIGLLIDHDFSEEFPEIFKGDEFQANYLETFQPDTVGIKEIDYWKEKYIQLLELYNQMLSKISNLK